MIMIKIVVGKNKWEKKIDGSGQHTFSENQTLAFKSEALTHPGVIYLLLWKLGIYYSED